MANAQRSKTQNGFFSRDFESPLMISGLALRRARAAGATGSVVGDARFSRVGPAFFENQLLRWAR
jgi:hypothetical protein